MKPRDFMMVLFGIAIAIILFVFIQVFFSAGQPERPPTIAGQEVPKENFVIDFSQRYNVIASQYRHEMTLQNVRMLGYTGRQVRDTSGGYSSSYEHFNRWLVIELEDGRLSYLPGNSISYLEQVQAVSE